MPSSPANEENKLNKKKFPTLLFLLLPIVIIGVAFSYSQPFAAVPAATGETSVISNSQLVAATYPSGIKCPTGTKPSGGWPLIFIVNGNCYKSVGTGGLAGDAETQLLATKQVCTAQIAHSDIVRASDIDNIVKTKMIPLIQKNSSFINAQKIGGVGFSAGGGVVSYLGTDWASGIDPVTKTNYNFRVGAILNLYGPLRLDRSNATDATGNITGGGGLLYLQETRKNANSTVDIPNIRQWDNPNCYCAARGATQCRCDAASTQYLNAYLTAYNTDPSKRTCSFYSDDANLVAMSPTDYIQNNKPTHVAEMYLCGGWKDSNVDYDMNVNQVLQWWLPQYRKIVRADDGHGFPLSVCTAAASAAGTVLPIAWLTQELNVLGSFPPATH